MFLAGIKVPDTVLVRDAIDLSRSVSEPFLFNHVHALLAIQRVAFRKVRTCSRSLSCWQ